MENPIKWMRFMEILLKWMRFMKILLKWMRFMENPTKMDEIHGKSYQNG